MDPDSGTLDAILKGHSARGSELTTLEEETLDILIFQIEKDWYAFAGSSIREILSQTEIFYVPGCISSMEGVINVRGDIESVINLSDTLGPRTSDYGPSWAILLGKAAGMQSGIRVDKVIDVLSVTKSSIQPAPASLPEKLGTMVRGVMRYQDVPVALLDLECLFVDYNRRLG